MIDTAIIRYVRNERLIIMIASSINRYQPALSSRNCERTDFYFPLYFRDASSGLHNFRDVSPCTGICDLTSAMIIVMIFARVALSAYTHYAFPWTLRCGCYANCDIALFNDRARPRAMDSERSPRDYIWGFCSSWNNTFSCDTLSF